MFKVTYETPSGRFLKTLVETDSEYVARHAVASRRDCLQTHEAEPVPAETAERFAIIKAARGAQAALLEVFNQPAAA